MSKILLNGNNICMVSAFVGNGAGVDSLTT